MPLVLFSVDVVALFATWAVIEPRSSIGLLYVALTLSALLLGGEHQFRFTPSVASEAPRLVQRLSIPLIGFVGLGAVVPLNPVILVLAPASVLAVLFGRAASYVGLRALRRRGWMMEDVIVVGAGFVGSELVRLLRDHPEYGLRPLGIVDDVGVSGVPHLGDLAEMDRVLDETAATHVIVAFSPVREPSLVNLVRSASRARTTVHVVPRFFEVGQPAPRPGTDAVHGIPLRQIQRRAMHSPAWPLKRGLDLIVSLSLIILTAPVMLIIAVLVRLGSPGPALFRQRRVGQGGRDFVLLKFRTLPVGYVDRQLNADPDDYEIPIGRFLRRTNLDELPQLFNIFCGHMTMVGPRPERRYLVEQFDHEVAGYKDRHRLPMGLTGLSQVHGLRGGTSIEERSRLDNYYIEHWSLWRDLLILVHTFKGTVSYGRRAAVGKGGQAMDRPLDDPSGVASAPPAVANGGAREQHLLDR